MPEFVTEQLFLFCVDNTDLFKSEKEQTARLQVITGHVLREKVESVYVDLVCGVVQRGR